MGKDSRCCFFHGRWQEFVEWGLMASGGSKDAACGAWWPPDTPMVLSNRGPTWAFVRILALSRPCLVTWLYDGPLNKG